MTTFEIDRKSRIQLARWMVKAPKKFRGATGMFLNNQAFGSRDEIIRFWQVDQTTRNKRFVKSKVKVEKTRLSVPTDQQKSSVFSLDGARFSGWSEQQSGTKTKRERVATKRGRGNSFKRQIKKKYRFTKRFWSPKDLGSSSAYIQDDHHRAQVMLMWARRNLGDDEPFLLYGHRNILPGLFEFDGGRLWRIQYLNSPRAQPTRIRWMDISVRRLYRKRNQSIEWDKVIKKQKVFDRRFK